MVWHLPFKWLLETGEAKTCKPDQYAYRSCWDISLRDFNQKLMELTSCKKSNLKCHTLINRTDLRRSPLKLQIKLFQICPKVKECTVSWRYEKLIRLSKVLKGPNGKNNSPDNNGPGEREMKRSGKIFWRPLSERIFFSLNWFLLWNFWNWPSHQGLFLSTN